MAKLTWIGLESKSLWDKVVSQFSSADIYYSYGYSYSFKALSDGTPYLIYYESPTIIACNVVILREIENTEYYDLISPYGYAGWIFVGKATPEAVSDMMSDYVAYCVNNNIVSEVIRVHPVINSLELLSDWYFTKKIGSVVVLETFTEQQIWNNITSKNRNVIRKAEKMGVEIKSGGTETLSLDKFKEVYDLTMHRAGASSFYFFNSQFYCDFSEYLSEEFSFFTASLEEELLAVAIITHKNEMLNYHLSGTTERAKGIPAVNLLLYKAACWGAKSGYKSFNLGGGVGASKDSLYKFKKSFSKANENDYYMLLNVFNSEQYDILVRKRECALGELKDDFFPKYRSSSVKGIL